MKKKSKLEKILFISDSHRPYHDKKAAELILKVGKALKPDHLIIMGDYADFYSVSSHSKSPDRKYKLKEEIEDVKGGLDDLKSLGAKNNVFIAGNHCDRLQRYMQDSAPELHKIVTIPKLLELTEKGYKYIPYKSHYKLGKLYVTHDTGTAGRYAHYKSLDSFQSNIVIAHTHRLGYAVEGSASGERHVGCMLGWLGDINEIDYMHKIKATRDWSLGFGIGYLEVSTGNVHVQPIPILNDYSCLIEGKIIKL